MKHNVPRFLWFLITATIVTIVLCGLLEANISCISTSNIVYANHGFVFVCVYEIIMHFIRNWAIWTMVFMILLTMLGIQNKTVSIVLFTSEACLIACVIFFKYFASIVLMNTRSAVWLLEHEIEYMEVDNTIQSVLPSIGYQILVGMVITIIGSLLLRRMPLYIDFIVFFIGAIVIAVITINVEKSLLIGFSQSFCLFFFMGISEKMPEKFQKFITSRKQSINMKTKTATYSHLEQYKQKLKKERGKNV